MPVKLLHFTSFKEGPGCEEPGPSLCPGCSYDEAIHVVFSFILSPSLGLGGKVEVPASRALFPLQFAAYFLDLNGRKNLALSVFSLWTGMMLGRIRKVDFKG